MRVFRDPMADTYEVVGAWLMINGDPFKELAGALMMRSASARRARRVRRCCHRYVRTEIFTGAFFVYRVR
jgi:hypothetical protein